MRQVKVWDPFVRLFHVCLALLVLGSFLTSERDALVPVHVRIGLAVLALVVSRIAWGFLGPAPARFRAFVRHPREILAHARDLARGRAPVHLTHNPLGGAMVVALLGVLAGLAITGALTYAGPEFGGALAHVLSRRSAHAMKEVHEALSGVLLGLVAAHVAGVLLSSLLERQNLVAGMITGWKRLPDTAAPESSGATGRMTLAHVAGAAAAAGVGAGAALGVAALLGIPAGAHAAAPIASELLREYEVAARRGNPAFDGFSAAAGRRLYITEFAQSGERVSCARCHTDDPRRRGQTPIGKVVEPLAPTANPERFTDRREVEKWFKRNCKQVIGRECTAEEKGNFLTYLLGA